MKRTLAALTLLLAPAAAHAGGSVAGVVQLGGPPPPLAPLKVTKDVSVCGANKPNEAVVASKSGGLANVVVSLRAAKPAAPPPPTANAAIDQQGCQYRPHVQAVTVGTSLVLVNSDAVLHNVHGHNGPVQAFNVAMPIRNQRVPARLTRPGLVQIQCDAGHTWMGAWVYVFEHPYFSVTGGDGKFEIKDVPAGHYTVEYWHEPADGRGAGVTKTAELDVKDGAPARADAVLKL